MPVLEAKTDAALIHADVTIAAITGKLNEMLAEATGKPLERVQVDTQRDYWMTAAEALEYGLISRIVTSHEELD